jgi:CheY-like chemotaxis protein
LEDLIEMALLIPVILIVEDEFLLRMDSAEVIENAGFEVIQAANADEAIAILTARPNIHVVFTDIQMPGSMDGLKLAEFVRKRWPPIKIVATSGLASPRALCTIYLAERAKSLIRHGHFCNHGKLEDHSTAALAISVRTAATSRMADIT